MTMSRFDDPDATWAPPAPGRYCLKTCYCGTCPQYQPGQRTHTPDRYTVRDREAILSSTGRRTNLGEYRQAQRDAGLIPDQKPRSA